MKQESGNEVLRSLDPGQKQRLVMYAKNLSTDKDPRHHDDRMVDYLMDLVLDPKWVDHQHKYLESLGWNQSMYLYENIKDQLHRFTLEDVPWFGWNEAYKKALEKMKLEISKWNLRSLVYHSKEDIIDAIPRMDTHAGFDYVLTGRKYKGDYIEDLLDYWLQAVKQARLEGSFNRPILIGTRTQTSPPYDSRTGERTNEYIPKPRMVSMISLVQVLTEMLAAKPFQKKLGQMKWYAGGSDDYTIFMYIGFLRKKYKNRWYSLDYSKFDQSIPAWIIHDCFDVVELAFKDDPNFDPELFRICRMDFVNKCFINGDMDIVHSTKGVPSGSMYTQIIDSLVNKLMIDSYMTQMEHGSYNMIIMGDDNLIYCRDEINLDNLSGYLKINFGIEMNPTKCGSWIDDGEDPEFLSRIWTMHGVYRRPEILFAKLVYPERFRDYKNNPQLSPALIVDAYLMTFELGMKALIDWKKHKAYVASLCTTDELDDLWMTGLMRYRKYYLNAS